MTMDEELVLHSENQLVVVSYDYWSAHEWVQERGLLKSEVRVATSVEHVRGLADFPYIVLYRSAQIPGRLRNLVWVAQERGHAVSEEQVHSHVQSRMRLYEVLRGLARRRDPL